MINTMIIVLLFILCLCICTITAVLYLCEYLEKKKEAKNLFFKKNFVELVESETKYLFLMNTAHIISIYSTEDDSALVTFQRPDGIEEIKVNEGYFELKKLIGNNAN